jgi:site-specific recombinase XerD
LDELLLYRTRHRQNLSLLGVKSDLVFCGGDGGPVKADSVRSGFRYLIARCGLDPALHFHCLRHTHATELLIAGIHPKVVAERIGDSVQTVMKTYAHATPDLQTEAAEKTDLVLRGLLAPHGAAAS